MPLLSGDQLFVSRTNFLRVLKGNYKAVTVGKCVMKKKKIRPMIRFTKILNEEDDNWDQ